MSVREHISETAGQIIANFVCNSPVAVARSSSGSVAIRYVLPVLWMTSRLAVMGFMVYFNTGAELNVYECLVSLGMGEFPLRMPEINVGRYALDTQDYSIITARRTTM